MYRVDFYEAYKTTKVIKGMYLEKGKFGILTKYVEKFLISIWERELLKNPKPILGAFIISRVNL